MKNLIKRKDKIARNQQISGRITNETVAEHREQILAGAQKFKYPLQYTKNRIVWLTSAVVLVAAVGFSVYVGINLYVLQSYDALLFKTTQTIPLPVANYDGTWVRYSDYLSDLRSSVHYLTTKEAVNLNTESGKQQLDYQKRQALDKAIVSAFVKKKAKENNISVTNEEINDFITKQIATSTVGVTEEVYKQIILDYYDWTYDEYKTSVKLQILKKKVSAAFDEVARLAADFALSRLGAGEDFANIAKEVSDDESTRDKGGDVGFVKQDSDDIDGLVQVALGLEVGQVSDVIDGADGLYIVKLLERNEAGDVRFAKILFRYTYVQSQIEQARTDNKITEYIQVTSSE